MTMKRPSLRAATAIAGTLATLSLGLTACGGSDGATTTDDGLTKVTIGISPFQDTYLPYIGQVKGWFKEAGLEVELKTLAWNAVMPAVASGSVDMAINNTTGVVSVANTSPGVVYAYGFNPFTKGTALMVRPDGGIKSVEDLESAGADHATAVKEAIEQLKGKTVVTTEGTDMGKALDQALQSVGMTSDDVKVVDMDTDAGLAAFLSGTGDAYIGGVPERAKAEQEGMTAAIVGADLAPAPINGVVTTQKFLDSDEDAVLELVNVINRIVRYCNDNTDDCAKTITDQLNKTTAAGLTTAGFEQYWQNIEEYAGTAAEAKSMILDESGVAYWKKTWDGDNDYLTSTKAIPSAVDASTNFVMQKVWDDYVAKYGADETGY
jgi:NitT/TauT family transport system substrate-binding protein